MDSLTLAIRIRTRTDGALVARVGSHWRGVGRLEPWFRLSGRERAFARELLATRSQLWLFRCHQRQFCGDFAVIDRSGACGCALRCWAIELKSGAGLRRDKRDTQLARREIALRSLAVDLRLVLQAPRILIGDGRAVLDVL